MEGRLDDLSHSVIANLYGAITPGGSCQAVADDFSDIFGGSIVALGLLPNSRDSSPGPNRYASGMDPDAITQLFPHLLTETPWSNRHLLRAKDGFQGIALEFEHL
jgi:hypothetical protein